MDEGLPTFLVVGSTRIRITEAPQQEKKKETLIINESLLIDLLEGAALKPAVTILINYRFFSATAGTYCSVITAFVCHQSR